MERKTNPTTRGRDQPIGPGEAPRCKLRSCGGLQGAVPTLLRPGCPCNLSSGLLKGRVQALGFDGFWLNLLTTNQTLFLSGRGAPQPCTLALPLDPSTSDGPQNPGHPCHGPGPDGIQPRRSISISNFPLEPGWQRW
ncbi:MAG: hypothetical protein CM15mP38_3430 [Synechococcus sp.]|nr:MAG: hypothetical protein CM15mP38_3430 [Synechococcus sp.]